jgi:uncharacterized protein (TIGR00251 family)
MDAIRKTNDGAVLLNFHVQPGAKRTEISGTHGNAIKLRLAAPPVDGKANACLIAFLANYFGVPRKTVHLILGETSRNKLVRIDQVSEQSLLALKSHAGLQ